MQPLFIGGQKYSLPRITEKLVIEVSLLRVFIYPLIKMNTTQS